MLPVNELSVLFHKLDINTKDVLSAEKQMEF